MASAASSIFGPDRDLPLFRDLPVERGPVETASIAVVTGLARDDEESAEDYRALLEIMRARELDLVCANPDRVVHVGDRLLPCAGAIGDLYEELGGRVIWAGKPYAPIYELALRKATALRGAAIDKTRVLMIGNSLKTDIAGAGAFGIDAMFIARGIHRDEMTGEDDARAVADLFRGAGVTAIGAMTALGW